MSSDSVRVIVLGSGTSTGIPVIGCKCEVCSSDDPLNRRLRSSIKIDVAGKTFVVDCGVDFREQMLAHPVDRLEAVLITHTHADHVHGLDDLRAFCFHQHEHIPIYTTPRFIEDIEVRFAYCFDPRLKGTAVPMLELKQVEPGESIDIAGVEVMPLEIMHGKQPILGFRVGNFAYMTDCSGIPEATLELLAGVETIIISGLREKPHPTHFSISQALEAAKLIGVKRAYLIHMAHTVDHRATEAELPDWARLAYDGLEIEIPL